MMLKYGAFTLTLFLFTNYSFGQVWGKTGATWHYEFYDYSSFSGGLYSLYYSGDTIVDGYACQKITVERQHIVTDMNGITSLGGMDSYTQITRYSGDSVFWYKDDEFFLMYDFGASVGDQWVIHQGDNAFDPECDTTSIVSVSDTGMMNVNGQNLKYIELTYVQGQYAINGRAIETMGVCSANWSPWNFTFPLPITCDTNTISEYYYNQFRCYTNDFLGTYNALSEPCDLPLLTLSSTNEEVVEEKKLLKMYDGLGRETNQVSQGLIFMYYSDGAVEKRWYPNK